MLVDVGGNRGDGRREGSIHLFGCHRVYTVLLYVLIEAMNTPSRAVEIVCRLLTKLDGRDR